MPFVYAFGHGHTSQNQISRPPHPARSALSHAHPTGDTVALGPGKVALLEAVHEHGSISAAARSLGMSYRRAWLLIDELNRSLKSPATISEQGGQSGGGCALTPVGENIVRLYREVEAQAEAACVTQIAALTRLIR